MQPYFFPYIGYWQLIDAADVFVIYDDVNYIKGGWINRNRILINGEPRYITISLDNASSNKLINQTSLCTEMASKTKILKTLREYYARAPYFVQTYNLVEELVLYPNNNLAEYLQNIILRVCEYLGIMTKIEVSSRIDKNDRLRGREKVIEICKKLGADEYINSIGGIDLYSKDYFYDNGIRLGFLKAGNIQYAQFSYPFVPNLSIIDVMMHNSVSEIGRMLAMFDMV